jgi:integration host factor subunit beta
MTKSQLVDAIALRHNTFKRKQIELIVDTIFNSIQNELSQEGRVEIRGFGSFSVRSRKSRQARNPKTGDSVQVPQKKIPFFVVGKELKERVDKGTD